MDPQISFIPDYCRLLKETFGHGSVHLFPACLDVLIQYSSLYIQNMFVNLKTVISAFFILDIKICFDPICMSYMLHNCFLVLGIRFMLISIDTVINKMHYGFGTNNQRQKITLLTRKEIWAILVFQILQARLGSKRDWIAIISTTGF